MRNRNYIQDRLDVLEATLQNLQRIVNTNEPIETYKNQISKAQDIISEVKSQIDNQPMDGFEQNPQ